MQFQKLKHFIILLSYFVFSIFLLFSLSGCYDATSVEDYYYVVALGIDEIENSDNINLDTRSVSYTFLAQNSRFS